MLSKNVNNKKCASKFIFFNSKKNQRDSNDSKNLSNFVSLP